MTRACVILSNGYSRVASATLDGTGVGNFPSIGHTVFGDLNSGLFASIGPFVKIDVVSNRLFELVLGFIAAIPLDGDGPSMLTNGATATTVAVAATTADDADADAIATVATGDCC